MRSSRLFAAVFVLALVATQVPLWSVRWVPMGDLGGHIELMDAVIRYDDPATNYAEVYTRFEGLAPNTFSLVAAQALGGIADARVVAKLLFGLFALTLPLSILFLCRVFGRSPWLAFAAFPFVYGGLTNFGLLNFLVAVPLLFVAVGLAKRFSDHGDLGSAALLGGSLIAIFFVHGLALFFALGCVALVIAVHVRRPAQVLRFAPLAAPVPFMVPWLIGIFDALGGPPGEEGADGPLDAFWLPLSLMPRKFYDGALQYFRDATDEVAFALIVTAWVLLAFSGWRQRGEGPRRDKRARVEFATPLLLAVACLAAFFVLPIDFRELAIVSWRVPILVCLFVAVSPAPDLKQKLDRFALGMLAAVAVAYPLVVAGRFVAWERDGLGDLEAAVATIEDRTRLAVVYPELMDQTFYGNVHWHIPKAMHVMQNGGVTNDSFARRSYTPIRYQPRQLFDRINEENYANHPVLSRYDVLLLRAYAEPKAARDNPWLSFRVRVGDYWLYDVDAVEAGRRVWAVGGPAKDRVTAYCADGARVRSLHLIVGPLWVTYAAPRCEPERPPGSPGIGGRAHDARAATLSCPEPLWVVGMHGYSGS
ncbi:MAG: hypothetical protein JRH11_04820, partial [Deltaproteobacteria bacterium]|nr:hypothetical protein [Deltaproteobacteria bacterium]